MQLDYCKHVLTKGKIETDLFMTSVGKKKYCVWRSFIHISNIDQWYAWP